jgi:predicted HicB family RNase H-like nuclease
VFFGDEIENGGVFIYTRRDLKMYAMRKKESKRINVRLDPDLYNQIEMKAAESYLRIATYTRQLIQQALKNNLINKN